MTSNERDNLLFTGTYEELKQKIKEHDGLVVVCFWTQWCPHCRRLSGILPSLTADKPTVLFLKIDIDENPDYTGNFTITGVPDVRFFRGLNDNGKPNEIGAIVGPDSNELKAEIDKHTSK